MDHVKQFSFDGELVPATERRVQQVFAGAPDYEELACDALSRAWELSKHPSAARATATQIAYYACLQVKLGRQFSESQRSTTGPNQQRKPKPRRVGNGRMEQLLDGHHADPADLAALKLDYDAWLLTLTDRERECLEAFLQGETTQDVAKRIGVSPARVSQIRRELVTFWRAFTE